MELYEFSIELEPLCRASLAEMTASAFNFLVRKSGSWYYIRRRPKWKNGSVEFNYVLFIRLYTFRPTATVMN